jgi:quercetin dioxygenase-like cupin family protein
MSVNDTITSESLLSATAGWNGAAYAAFPAGAPELTVLRMTIAANASLAWHTHPMPNAAYIISGGLTIELPGGTGRRFAAGEVTAEMVDTVHRGVAGDQPAVVIVFYAGVQGMPLSIALEP